MPLWLEYTEGFFPVICAVFVLRSFIAEPFKIPSGSMIPTLQIGDFILVNKFTYGIRLPVLNQKVVDLGAPKRGDVVVFRYPRDESVDYIKRVVAIPGDQITYENKRLTINGQPLQYSGGEPYLDPENMRYAKRFTETFPADLGSNRHEILNDPDRPATVFPTERFPGSEFCQYQQSGMTCKVPPGHYFAMGTTATTVLTLVIGALCQIKTSWVRLSLFGLILVILAVLVDLSKYHECTRRYRNWTVAAAPRLHLQEA